MRIFYTLLVSGLLIFHEVPIDQHPPATSDDVPYGVASSLSSELGMPSYGFPTQYKPNFSAQSKIEKQPSSLGKSEVGPELPVEEPTATKATATPVPKIITADTALATYRQPSSLPITGYAMFYNPNVMQEVVHNRMKMGHISECPECIGNVALLRAGDLNRRVWLEWADGTVEGPFLVADTAAQHHVAQLLARRWVVDVDNRTAVRRGMAGPVLVTVWGSPPSSQGNQDSQADTPPFMPLYSALPTALSTPISTPLPTPLPALDGVPYAELVAKPVGFPKDTATPTITPLPVIATTAPPATTAPTAVAAASATPTITLTLAAVHSSGFPADTPVPTITPLPVIVTTTVPLATSTPVPTVTMVPTATPTLAPTLTATMLPTMAPSFTPTPTPTPEAGTDAPTVVIQRGFPTDTPVPTITPLPFITPTPTLVPDEAE